MSANLRKGKPSCRTAVPELPARIPCKVCRVSPVTLFLRIAEGNTATRNIDMVPINNESGPIAWQLAQYGILALERFVGAETPARNLGASLQTAIQEIRKPSLLELLTRIECAALAELTIAKRRFAY